MIDPRHPDYSNTPASPQRPAYDYRPARASEPAITIVTPFHNAGEVFRETAQTVFGQSLQQFEWVIVNDASTCTESLRILDEFRSRDPRVRVIDHERNRGQGTARNTGFRAARAPYVLTLDSDDLLEPTTAEKWLWFLESHANPALVNSWSVIFEGESLLWPLGFQQGRANLDENFVSQTTLVTKAVHQAVGGYDESREVVGVEDWDFWMRCAAAGHWGWSIDEYLVWYRARPPTEDRWNYARKLRWLQAQFRTRYPVLTSNFPEVQLDLTSPDDVPEAFPCSNPLEKRRPRLIVVVAWMIMGGAEKFNLDLIRGFRANGWEVTLVTTLWSEDAWTSEFTRLTPDVFRLASFLAPADYPRFLSYLISSRSPDAVMIINSELAYQLLPWVKSRHPTVPVVDFCHMEKEDWRGGGYPRYSIDYRDMLDLTMVSSNHLRTWIVEREPEKGPVEVVYTGAEVIPETFVDETRQRVRREYGLDEGTAVLLYACRICPQKQPEVFAEVIRALDRSDENFVAWVAGEGEDAPWLTDWISRQNLAERVRFHGPVPIDRMRELMSAADIFFLPSESEGIALTLYEAMACSCTIVAADVGGQRELVSDDCGVLVTRGEVRAEIVAYEDALTRLIQDAPLRRAMASAGRRRVTSAFSVDEMQRKVVSAIERTRVTGADASPTPVAAGIARAHAVLAVRQAAVDRDFMSRRASGDGSANSALSRAYYSLASLGGPLYRFALRRGWTSVATANLALKRLVHRLTS